MVERRPVGARREGAPLLLHVDHPGPAVRRAVGALRAPRNVERRLLRAPCFAAGLGDDVDHAEHLVCIAVEASGGPGQVEVGLRDATRRGTLPRLRGRVRRRCCRRLGHCYCCRVRVRRRPGRVRCLRPPVLLLLLLLLLEVRGAEHEGQVGRRSGGRRRRGMSRRRRRGRRRGDSCERRHRRRCRSCSCCRCCCCCRGGGGRAAAARGSRFPFRSRSSTPHGALHRGESRCGLLLGG